MHHPNSLVLLSDDPAVAGCAEPLQRSYKQQLLRRLYVLCDIDGDGILTFGEFRCFLESLKECDEATMSRIEFLQHCADLEWPARAGAAECDVQDLVCGHVHWQQIWHALKGGYPNVDSLLCVHAGYRFGVFSCIAERTTCKIIFPEQRLARLPDRPHIRYIADTLGVLDWWQEEYDQTDGGPELRAGMRAAILSSMRDTTNRVWHAVLPHTITTAIHIIGAEGVETVDAERRADISTAAYMKLHPPRFTNQGPPRLGDVCTAHNITYWRVVYSHALLKSCPLADATALHEFRRGDIVQGNYHDYGSGWRGELFIGTPEGEWIRLFDDSGFVQIAIRRIGRILIPINFDSMVSFISATGDHVLFVLWKGQLEFHRNGRSVLQNVNDPDTEGLTLHFCGEEVAIPDSCAHKMDEFAQLYVRSNEVRNASPSHVWTARGVAAMWHHGLLHSLGEPVAGDVVVPEQFSLLYRLDLNLWNTFLKAGYVEQLPRSPLLSSDDGHSDHSSYSSTVLSDDDSAGDLRPAPASPARFSEDTAPPVSLSVNGVCVPNTLLVYKAGSKRFHSFSLNEADRRYYIHRYYPHGDPIICEPDGEVESSKKSLLIPFMGGCVYSGPETLSELLGQRGYQISEVARDRVICARSCFNKCNRKCVPSTRHAPSIADAHGICPDESLCHAKVYDAGQSRQCQRLRSAGEHFCGKHLDARSRPLGSFFCYSSSAVHYQMHRINTNVETASLNARFCRARVGQAGWTRQCRRFPTPSGYCKLHLLPVKRKLGDVDLPAPSIPCENEVVSRLGKPKRRAPRVLAEKWFTLSQFTREMRRRSHEDVSKVTDAEFNSILSVVHKYYMKNKETRDRMQLQANAGPLDASERHTAKFFYDVAGHGRWYSRITMLRMARQWKLSGVDAMTDEQFSTALQRTHNYLLMNAQVRASHALELNCGPRDGAERYTAKAFYVGAPKRFAYYDHSLMVLLCRPCLACTENEFDQALRKINFFLSRFEFCQVMSRDHRYMGPQCWSQFGDIDRFRFQVLVNSKTYNPFNKRTQRLPKIWELIPLAALHRRKRRSFQHVSRTLRKKHMVAEPAGAQHASPDCMRKLKGASLSKTLA